MVERYVVLELRVVDDELAVVAVKLNVVLHMLLVESPVEVHLAAVVNHIDVEVLNGRTFREVFESADVRLSLLLESQLSHRVECRNTPAVSQSGLHGHAAGRQRYHSSGGFGGVKYRL